MMLIPDEIAKAMASLITSSNSTVLDPYSGKGEIVQHLPSHVEIWGHRQ